MKIAVVGPGAIGTYLSCLLSHEFAEITLFGRNPNSVVENREFWIGSRTYTRPEVQHFQSDAYFDVIFVCVKAADTACAVSQLASHRITATKMYFLHNGFLSTSAYEPYFSRSLTANMTVYDGHELTGNHLRLQSTGKGWVAPNDGFSQQLVRKMAAAGIPISARADYPHRRKEKFLLNCVVNALAAIENKTLGELLSDKRLRQFMSGLYDEVDRVMTQWTSLSGETEEFANILQMCACAKEHRPSMLQDVLAGRATEIDALNGFVSALGRDLRLSTPYCDFLLRFFENQKLSQHAKEGQLVAAANSTASLPSLQEGVVL